MKRYVSEAMGTFAIVFTGTAAIVVNDVSDGKVTHVGISLVFGLIVMAMVYALGDRSGAHLNPAVTLGFWSAGRFAGREVGPYIASQLVGALLGSLTVRLLFEHPTLGATIPTGPAWQSLVLEILLTALLMMVILGVSSGSKEKGLLAGVAVGGVIALEALFAGPISGASMNPARSLAPALVSGRLAEVWIYIAGPILGAGLGVLAHRAVD